LIETEVVIDIGPDFIRVAPDKREHLFQVFFAAPGRFPGKRKKKIFLGGKVFVNGGVRHFGQPGHVGNVASEPSANTRSAAQESISSFNPPLLDKPNTSSKSPAFSRKLGGIDVTGSLSISPQRVPGFWKLMGKK
jgi:hypothetical protein